MTRSSLRLTWRRSGSSRNREGTTLQPSLSPSRRDPLKIEEKFLHVVVSGWPYAGPSGIAVSNQATHNGRSSGVLIPLPRPCSRGGGISLGVGGTGGGHGPLRLDQHGGTFRAR